MLLPLILLAAAGPVLGPLKSFGDWAVACDNVKRCEMTSLVPEAPETSNADEWQNAMLSIVREPGPAGGFTVDVALQTQHRGAVVIDIDDREVARREAAGETAVFTGGDAARIVAAIVRGRMIEIGDGRAVIARVSLAGSSAALRFIDAEQGRAGGVTAAVATGPKPATAVPPARPLPTVAAVPPPSGAAAKVMPAQRKAMMAASKCDDEFTGANQPVEAFRLDARTTLALLPCGAGAYNFNSVPFVIVGGRPALARFDHAAGWSAEGPMPMLVNATFEKGRLGSYAKGRGIGDCGSAEEFVWDGAMFRLVEARAMGECRGSVNWLTLWRAAVVGR